MKKIMIAAVATLIGFAANAAAVVWEAGDVYEYGTGDFANDYIAFWVDASVTSYDVAQTKIAAGDVSFITGTTSNGLSVDGYVDPVTVNGYGNGQSVTGYVVIFNASDISSATHAYLSDSFTKATGPEGQSAVMVFDTSSTEVASNWAAVPEPTSGLLLLLGMAGLALRRKQA